jgi:hypothetical protein
MNESATALTVLNNPAETAKSAGVDLVKYSAARHALIMACDIDEVLKIKNVATAAQVYAQQAQDRELIDRAVDLRLRAERKAGEMLRKLAKYGERDLGAGGDRRSKITVDALTVKPRTLADLGIKKHQSVRYQGLADLPADDFESKIKVTQDRIAGVKVSLKEKSGPDYRDKLIRHLKSAIRRGEKEIIPFIDDFKPDEEIDCLFDRMAKVWGFIARERSKKRTRQASEGMAEPELEPDEVPPDGSLDAEGASAATPDDSLDIPAFLDRRPKKQAVSP